MIRIAWIGLFLCVQASAAKVDGFMGHYGYLLSVPVGYQAHPEFDGDTEVVQFIPAACKTLTRAQCVGAGMFGLLVTPKKGLFAENGITAVSQYAKGMRAMAASQGEAPEPLRTTSAGPLKGWTITKKPKNGPFDTSTYIDGKKVCYVFTYQKADARMKEIIDSLVEVTPNDDPPARR